MVEPVERSDERVGPGPVIGKAQLGLMAGTHSHASDVEQAVAEPLGLGEVAVEVEVEMLLQPNRSWASITTVTHAWLMAIGADGRFTRPVSLASQIRRSARPPPRSSASR